MACTSILNPLRRQTEYSLAPNAAKTRIDILVVRLEPVAKGRAQHARGGARRSTFHDEVLAIKKIGGVATVKRKWLESGEWSKNGGGPLPPIAEQIVDAESALGLGKRIYGQGVPAMKVEITELGVRRFAAPGVWASVSVKRAVGGAVPLGLGGERLPCPAGVGGRLGVT